MSLSQSNGPIDRHTSANNGSVTPQNEDQIPMNESRAQFNDSSPTDRHRPASLDNKQTKFYKKTQVLYWFVVVLLAIVIGYYIHDNNVQEREISHIIDIVKSKQSTQIATQDQLKLQHEANSSNLNQIAALNKSTERQDMDKAQQTTEDIINKQNGTPHEQVQLKKYPFDEIPKRVWHFNAKKFERSSLWTQKCYEQHKRVASQSNHEFLAINSSNFDRYLTEQRYKLIKMTMVDLNARYHTRQQPQLIRYKDLLIKQLIILEVLIENGGIFIDEDIILTQDITWVDNISDNAHVNARQWIRKALLIAFHSIHYSSPIQYLASIQSQIQAEKYIVLYPSISPYFLASNKQNQFLTLLRDEFYNILKSPKSLNNRAKDLGMQILGLKYMQSTYENMFQIASQIVLHQKQKQLANGIKAIQYFQIATINQNYGPTKIKAYLTIQPTNKIFNHLSRMTRNELQYEFGALRYLLNIEPKFGMYVILLQYMQKSMIVQHSLIHETLFHSSNESFIQKISPQVQSSQRWDSLPAKIWIYSQKNSYNTELFNQIWLQNIRAVAKQSKFQLIILTRSNLHQYLPKDVLKRIQNAINPNRTKIKVYSSTKKQMISLAILYEHGGVWVDSETYLVDSLQWLRNINNEPYVWNKNGKTPQVVLTFQPHYGSSFDWTYNSAGIKQIWHLAYENSFIAAIPKAQLINDWLTQFIDDLAIPFQNLLSKFYLCKISQHRWIGDWSQEMLPHDAIKCVLGAKKVELATDGKAITPNEYYGLWAINGYAGYLKMREYTNFITTRSMSNPFIWRYSFEEMQSIVGKVRHFTRIYKYTSEAIEQLYKKDLNNLQKEFHKDSFFMYNLLTKVNAKILISENGLMLQSQLLNYQQSLKIKEQQKYLSKIQQIVWVYQGGQIEKEDKFTKNIIQNIEYYAQLSKYQVRLVDYHNYQQWLPKIAKAEVISFLNSLKKKLDKQKSNLKDHYENIVGHYITLTLLYQLGGIAINKRLILHQNLDWIKSVEKNEFINKRGNSLPKVFAFFGPGYSTKRTIQNNEEFVQYPSIENYFLASGKKTEFIKDFRKKFNETIIDNFQCKQKIKNIGHQSGWIRGQDPYYEAFFLASQFTLTAKQKQLTQKKDKKNALEYYGLYTMNSRYFGYRLNNFIHSLQMSDKNLCQYLGGTQLAEIQKQIGPLRYLSVIPKYKEIKNYITKNAAGQKGYDIVEHSFLHKYLIFGQQAKGIIKFQNPKDKEISQWSSLPQDVWIYKPKNVNQSVLMTQLLFLHLNKTFTSNGYKVHSYNDEDINKYLDKSSLELIKKMISEKKNMIYKQSIYKLALLQKNGGVSIPFNFLISQNLTWIKAISNFTSQLIFNRADKHPKVLLFVDSLRNPSLWSYNEGIKVGHMLGWNDGFIAADKDSQLIKQWFNLLVKYIQADSKKQVKAFEDCGMKDHRRSKSIPSKLSLDILQCVLNEKHSKLEKQKNKKDVCNYYGLWGISDYLGPAKFEEQLNLDATENDLNPLLWKWSQSQAESLIGKVNFMSSINNKQLIQISQLINKQKLKEWGKKDSFLVKTLYASTKTNLIEKDGKVVIKQ